MSYPKHENNGGGRKKRGKKSEAVEQSPAAEYHKKSFGNSGCVEEAVDGLASVISTFVRQELNGDNAQPLYSSPSGYPVRVDLNPEGYPIKLTYESNDCDDAVDRFVTALERIADSVARLAGLSRPRLESWHEQVEYEPRYKSSACDGGAPGPKAPKSE